MFKKIIILLLLGSQILAQKAPKDPKGGQIILSQQNQATSKFVVYEPAQPSKGLYKNISEAINNTPQLSVVFRRTLRMKNESRVSVTRQEPKD